ncbi:MAG: deoxyribodipyrimidine photo-lyase [Culicoidibacterales bacterium]
MANQRIVNRYNTYDKSQEGYILYWVQSSLFLTHNFSLHRLLTLAAKLEKKVKIVFMLTAKFPFANTRNMDFLLQGLFVFKQQLAAHNLILEIYLHDQVELSAIFNQAAIVITDQTHSYYQKMMLDKLAASTKVYIETLENNLIVPVPQAYPKKAYAASVFRKPIWQAVGQLIPLVKIDWSAFSAIKNTEVFSIKRNLTTITAAKAELFSGIPLVAIVEDIVPGMIGAEQRFSFFLAHLIKDYNGGAIDLLAQTSYMSSYLHFGHISPITLLLACQKIEFGPGVENFLEQLVVRRELAFNYMHYTDKNALSFAFLPNWALMTMEAHKDDVREYLYTQNEFESAKTHDIAWNAAQTQLLTEGRIHNYLRMYWAKKIIEWTPDYQTAFEIMRYLNDTYQLDGRDPNGYVGILWNFGLHDRAWFDRPIFGKLRFMNYNGLKAKTNIAAYINKYQ